MNKWKKMINSFLYGALNLCAFYITLLSSKPKEEKKKTWPLKRSSIYLKLCKWNRKVHTHYGAESFCVTVENQDFLFIFFRRLRVLFRLSSSSRFESHFRLVLIFNFLFIFFLLVFFFHFLLNFYKPYNNKNTVNHWIISI